MPTYEYECESCGHELEAFQSMTADHLTKCPECGKDTLKRKIGIGAGIIFKGSGFYETDYKDKNGGKKNEVPKKGEGKGDKSDKSESKTEGKSEAKKEVKSTTDGKKSDKSGGGDGKK